MKQGPQRQGYGAVEGTTETAPLLLGLLSPPSLPSNASCASSYIPTALPPDLSNLFSPVIAQTTQLKHTLILYTY